MSPMKRRPRNLIGKNRAAADENAVRLGAQALDAKRCEEAERVAREVLARNPQHAGALHLLGIAVLSQGRAREAVAPLQQAAHDCNDALIETHLGKALRESGRMGEALTWLRRAATRTPPLSSTFHELGILLAMQRRYDEAEAAFKRGLELAPTDADLSVELGGVYISRAEAANAKLAFARALSQVPGHPRALHGFGTALLFEGEFARAAERFRQVLARNPSHVRARLDLGHCLLELGRLDEAAACLRAMTNEAPQLHGKALKVLVSAGRGRFWLRPSAAAMFLRSQSTGWSDPPAAQ